LVRVTQAHPHYFGYIEHQENHNSKLKVDNDQPNIVY
jgi:hypothetical protein